MELMDMLMQRRSIRKYTGEEIPQEKLEKVIQAGLLAFSGKGLAPTEMIVIRDKETIEKLMGMRSNKVVMLEHADAAIAVLGDADKSDTIIEDSSIVMANMHLMASALGVGSCWIQGRGREAIDGETTEDFLRRILQFPAECRLEAILALGMPDENLPARTPESLPFYKVHINKY